MTTPRKPKPESAPDAAGGRIYHLQITLENSDPPIWRLVAVPGDYTLGQLHVVIQLAMGWEEDHLHQFIQRDKSLKLPRAEISRRKLAGIFEEPGIDWRRGPRTFASGTDPMGGPLDLCGFDEEDFTLADVCPRVRSKLVYEYDFGDNWKHEIEVKKIVEPEPGVKYPVCLDGKLACPLEDSGGVWGFYAKLDAVKDPNHEDHDDYVEWFGDFDPEAFDIKKVNKALAKCFKAESSR